MVEPSPLCNHNLVIATPRLILRDADLSNECLQAMFRIRSDPRMLKTVNNLPPDTVDGMKDWMAKRLGRPNSFIFIIELRHPEIPGAIGTSDNVIGSCGGNRTPEFGYSIDPEHWGKGYASEAMRAAIDAYWDTWPEGMPSLPKDRRDVIELNVGPDNAASIAVARKLGFQDVGEGILTGTGGIHDGDVVKQFRLERPASDRQRAYEKIEVLGPNPCAGPALLSS